MSFSITEPLRVGTGQSPIFQSGQTGRVWRVRQGIVRLDRQCGPIRLPVQLALPGDLIGVEALCDQPYQFSAEALTACELEPVDIGNGDDRQALSQRARLLGDVLLQQQARSHDMATLRTGSVLQRLSHLMSLLGLPWQGAQSADGQQVDAIRESLPTLREVAEIIDAKTETVCRALAQLLPPRTRKSGPARKRPLGQPANLAGFSTPLTARPAGAWSRHDLAMGRAA